MKRVLTIPVLALLSIVALSACKKNYTCSCRIDTVLLENDKLVDQTTEQYTIRENEDNAKAACKYYELEVTHLQRRALEQHYCEISGEE